MIPKKIHYCWLSVDRMPKDTKACLKSWKKIMPDYELVLWDKSRFDISRVQFVAEACSAKKWASASDYIRLYAVYNEGGIYLDSDVMIHKSFSDFLHYDFFSCVEYHQPDVERDNSLSLLNDDGTTKPNVTQVPGIAVQAAVFGGIQGHSYLKDCMNWYETNPFFSPNGRGYNTDYIAPDIFALIAQKYGFRYRNELQNLNQNMVFFSSDLVAGDPSKYTDKSYATHYVAHSWYDRTLSEKIKLSKPYKALSKNRVLRKLLGK